MSVVLCDISFIRHELSLQFQDCLANCCRWSPDIYAEVPFTLYMCLDHVKIEYT